MNASRGLAIAALVVIAGGAGYLIQRELGDGAAGGAITAATAPANGAVTPTAAPAEGSPADEAAAPPRPVVPEVLPQFEMKDREGKLRRLGDWKGRPLVVNYWATWCPPCVREIPLLSRLRQEHKAANLEVIGVAIDFRDDVLAFAEKRKVDYPLLIGDDDGYAAVTAVGMEPTFPFTLFADSQQRIVALKVGELHQDEAELILARVAQIDGGHLDLPAAREQISAGLKELAVQRAKAEAEAEAAGKSEG